MTSIASPSHKGNTFWRPICPFSISDQFEIIEDKKDDARHNKKFRAYLYEFIISPDPFNAKLAILTPKTISPTLELPFLKFKINYPQYRANIFYDGHRKINIINVNQGEVISL